MSKHQVEEETRKHIRMVRDLLDKVKREIMDRALNHDLSKLHSPECDIFEIYTEKLKGCTYGSDEYKRFLKEMKPALDHHYANNRHHPEHFELTLADDFQYHTQGKKNLICCMTLIDITEMICDWYAATKRHADGDIMKSIEINQKRFGYGDELKQVFINTVQALQAGPCPCGSGLKFKKCCLGKANKGEFEVTG